MAFTDGEITPLGAFGDTVKRNTPTLINLADNSNFNWGNESLTSLQSLTTQKNISMSTATEEQITIETASKLGLLPEEFEKIKTILGRTPNFTELSIFSVPNPL